MSNEIKSHVYVAESILNRFSHKDSDNRNIINYIDTRLMILKSSSTRTFNRKTGYFSSENEQVLKSQSEDKIGNVIHKLERYRNEKKYDFILSNKEKNVIKKYLSYQWLRNDYLNNLIVKKLNLEISIEDLKNILIKDEEKTKLIMNNIDKIGFCIIFNNSDKQYILNSCNSLWNKDSKEYYIITIILSPYISIKYCLKKTMQTVFNAKNDYVIIVIDEANAIFNTNVDTYLSATKNNPYFIVGREEELQEIIDRFKLITNC